MKKNTKYCLNKQCNPKKRWLPPVPEIDCHDCFVNLRFGILNVVRFLGIGEHDRIYYLCLCDCGNLIVETGQNLKTGNKKSCGCLSESYIASELKKYFHKNYSAVLEYKVLRNPKTGYFLPYDIYLPNENIFIEVQGIQHYEAVSFWNKKEKDFEYQQEKDLLKRNFAETTGTFICVDIRKLRTPEKALDYIMKECLFFGIRLNKNKHKYKIDIPKIPDEKTIMKIKPPPDVLYSQMEDLQDYGNYYCLSLWNMELKDVLKLSVKNKKQQELFIFYNKSMEYIMENMV